MEKESTSESCIPFEPVGHPSSPVNTATPSVSIISIIPLYELHQHDNQDLRLIQAHVHHNKPLAPLIEALLSAKDTRSTNISLDTAYLSNMMAPTPREALLESWFNQQLGDSKQNLLDITEQLLETAIYLGMDASFCTFIIAEMMYIIIRTNTDICMYEPLENYTIEYIPIIIWKDLPTHPFLRQCLLKDLNFAHLDILRRKKLKGALFVRSSCTLQDAHDAIFAGNLRFLQLLHPLVKGVKGDNIYTRFAAELGRLHILIWLRQQGYSWDETTCSSAALHGHLDVLKWARQEGCPWDEATCRNAALNGHLHILKWARESGCPWDLSTCSQASRNGNLDVLKWVRAQECPWDEWTMIQALLNGHLLCFYWAKEHGCPFSPGTMPFFEARLAALKRDSHNKT